ncbi:MAG: choline ABC transporter substrate-binding protein [Gammaproteobacteria bacterium]|nr:choline ABC transporter substrate-binding protein [Gammaproteobacteria bacterium]
MLTKSLLAVSTWVAISAMSVTAFAAEADSCKQVRMADPGWTDITATNAVAEVLLGALGYEQHVDRIAVPVTYQGLTKGQTDVFLGNWMPAQQAMVEPKIKEGSIELLRTNLENVKFTLAVPSYVADAGVKSFADLAKFADKFDHKIYGIESGAPANQNIERMLKAKEFGLDGWTLVASSEQGMLTQVTRKTRHKEWIVFLGWEPHLMNTKFKITYLAGGDAYFGANYGAASVNTVMRKGYEAQCPNVGRLFRQLAFNVDLENQIITDVLENKVDAKKSAMRHLKDRPALLDAWLAGVQTRDGADGLPAVKRVLGIN